MKRLLPNKHPFLVPTLPIVGWSVSTLKHRKQKKFCREATGGQRTPPNGTDLKWVQIAVKEITDTREFPFSIQWLSADCPSQDGTPIAEIEKIVIADTDQLANSWFKEEILASLRDVTTEWVDPSTNDD